MTGTSLLTPSIPGVTVSLDETGKYPELTITFPRNVRLPKLFVRACHKLAGDHGAGIEFLERS